jgi:outer membrane receptor protein involved in Fe transport
MNKSFNVSLFGKHYWTKHTYLQDTRTSSIMGYGAALAYSLFDMQLKGSYERTHRLPSGTELFGDGALEWANFDLKPEKGDNFNIGLSGSRTFGRNHMAYFDVSYNYRYITNYIRRNVYGEGSRASVENFGKVLSSGVNAEVRYNYRGLLTIGGNITSQNVKNNEKYKQGGDKVPSTTYKMRMPNVPYLFGNADAGITVRNLGVKGNDLFVGYNLHYIHEFYYDWSIYGEKDSKDMVPSQLSHDVNVSYSFLKKHFNVSAEVNNITNEKLYDNYYIQKPGRNFIIKLRYIY